MDASYILDRAPFIYWQKHEVISYIQRKILIHSIIYYRLSDNVIPDEEYDAICKLLCTLQNDIDMEEFEKTTYAGVFEDFDGSTGFHLVHRLEQEKAEYLEMVAYNILLAQRRRRKNER